MYSQKFHFAKALRCGTKQWILGTSGVLLGCLFLLLVSIPAAAQGSSATISGNVSDSSGAKISGADVKVTSADTNFAVSTKTNAEGYYVVTGLHPGGYSLVVTMSGFKQVARTDIVLHVQDTVEFDFRLEVGAVSETVTVQGTAGEVETSPSVSTVVDRQFVSSIPLNGRTIQSLISLTPGVVATAPSFGEPGQFSVNGQRTDSNYYTVDGVSANAGVEGTLSIRQSGGSVPGFSGLGTTSNLVSVDAIQEFRIQTSTFAPEFGRTPGAQVSIVTRSGSNQWHGTLFEYFRNDVLDASDWFNGYLNNPPLAKPKERQNDYGGVLGGPLIKDKTFFFFSYEGLQLRQPHTYETIVPDEASRSAVPAALQPMVKAFPLPTAPATAEQQAQGIAPANGTVSDPVSLSAVSLRLDQVLTRNVRLFARYNYAPSKSSSQGGCCAGFGEPLNYVATNNFRTQTLTAGASANVGSSIVNETLFNYTHNSISNTNALTDFGGAIVPQYSDLIPASEGVNATADNSAFEFHIIGVGLFDVGRLGGNKEDQYNIVDNFSLLKRTHQLKFGFDYRRTKPSTSPAPYFQIPVFLSVNGPFASVQSGTAIQAVIISDESVPLAFNNYSVYGQDTWNVSSRLTLTYGLRWDVNPAPTATGGKQLYTFTDPYDIENLTLAPKGTPFYQTTWGNFAPRVGIAYSLRQDPKFQAILRGGYGLFYDLGSNQTSAAATSWPYLRLGYTLFAPFPFDPSVAAPIPFSLTPPYGQLATADPKLELPRTQQWNVSLEQGLGKDQSLTLSYVGAVGRKLLRLVSLSSFPNVANGELISTNGGTSDYHGLQVQFRRRLSSGLQALASYTWSHSIDTQSYASGSSTAPPTAYNPDLDRGSSDFDIRHTVSGALTYDIPAPSLGSAGKYLLGGWSVDTILTARSATPVGISTGSSLIGPGGSSIVTRPDVVAGQPFYISDPNAPGGKRLNPAAFTAPPTGQQGSLPRNSLRGFAAWQPDFAIRREFKLHDRTTLTFRSELFNVFNHPNFADFNGNLSSSLFGYSTSTLAASLSSGGGLSQLYQIGGPRSIQFALKLSF